MRKKSTGAATKRPKKRYDMVVLARAIAEGRKELNDGEYCHIVKILKKLVNWGDESKMGELSVKSIDGIYELCEKWGLLGKKNMRFYFDVFPELGKIVIAKTYRKDEEGQPPRHIILNAQNRLFEWKEKKALVGATYRAPPS